MLFRSLSAISVFGEEVGIRLLLASSILILISLMGSIILASIKFFTSLAPPGWVTTAISVVLIVLFNGFILSLIFIFIILKSRDSFSFLPLRDYKYYIIGIVNNQFNPQVDDLEEVNDY